LFAADKSRSNPDVAKFRTTYEIELRKINYAEFTDMSAIQESHIQAMKVLQKKMQEAGNLEALLATGKEIERFRAENKIEKSNLSLDVPDLLVLQNGYIKSVEKLSLDKARKIMALAQGYDKSMSSLQEVLTRKNDINGAMEIKNAREAVKQRAEVTSAGFLLADAETKGKDVPKEPEKSVEKPKEKEPEQVAGKMVVKKSDTSSKKKYTGNVEKRIRKRFDELCKCIIKQDFAKASDYVNPKIVKESGAPTVKAGLMTVFSFVFIGATTDPHVKLGVDSVKLEEDGLSAILVPRLWVINQWRDLEANKWVAVDGDWYIDF
ncbi:MAG: hypothetical protein PHR77_20650, partial [Kiritimatiellae bacterium]|nr:hypothetical protein [Kiritimatiellia bacterium]